MWDICAPAAVLVEAGGLVSNLFAEPLRYGTQVQNTQGLFAATGVMHRRFAQRVKSGAEEIIRKLEAMEEYPPTAFRR